MNIRKIGRFVLGAVCGAVIAALLFFGMFFLLMQDFGRLLETIAG